MSRTPAIGGFFPLEIPEGPGGLLGAWTAGRRFAAFGNARSALAALVARLAPRRVWLPAFLCAALADGVPPHLRRYYRLDRYLSPDPDGLAAAAGGDMVVAIDYFGTMPGDAFRDFAAERPDVVFVEDCAHCALPEPAGWGDWRLFSPRKVAGVADGGILVSMRSDGVPPQPAGRDAEPDATWRAALLRFEDEDRSRSAVWHAANQAREAAMAAGDAAMSRLGLTLLGLVDPAAVARRRRENFAALEAACGDRLLPLHRRAADVPFAFPLVLDPDVRDGVLRHLHAEGIFAAVHWRDLPTSGEEFPEVHRLSRSLISLPCDQRYGPEEMSLIVSALRQVVR